MCYYFLSGQPLSLVVAINDHKNQFDMKVKSCFAHDGVRSPIYLIDEDGCVLRPNMFSEFKKFRSPNGKNSGKASLISYAQFLAFKFPDSVDVQIQCTVEVCRHGCSNTCESYRSRNKENYLTGSMDNAYQPKANSGHEVNRFLMENADLLESASANEPVSVNAPENLNTANLAYSAEQAFPETHSVDNKLLPSTTNKQSQLNNIAAFVQDVEHKVNPMVNNGPELTASSPGEFNVMGKLSMNNGQHSGPIRMKIPLPGHNSLPMHTAHPRRPFAPPKHEPVAQVMNIPLSPMFMPNSQPHLPNILNPFNSLRMLKSKKNSLLPQLISNYYFGKNRRSQYVPNDNFEFVSKLSPGGHRVFRTRRFVRDKQGEVGLKRGFQVVTSLDLSFAPNMSADMPIYEGIRAPIVYGLCFSTTHIFFFVAVSLSLLVIGILSCVYIVCRLERAKRNRH